MRCDIISVPADLVGSVRRDLRSGEGLPRGAVREQLDIDKLWEAVHVVLGGAPRSSGGALTGGVFGGEPIRVRDGYGHWLHDAQATAALAGTLGDVTEQGLRDGFDLERLAAADVYPHIWDEDPEELADEVVWATWEVVALVRRAAAAGDGLVVAV